MFTPRSLRNAIAPELEVASKALRRCSSDIAWRALHRRPMLLATRFSSAQSRAVVQTL